MMCWELGPQYCLCNDYKTLKIGFIPLPLFLQPPFPSFLPSRWQIYSPFLPCPLLLQLLFWMPILTVISIGRKTVRWKKMGIYHRLLLHTVHTPMPLWMADNLGYISPPVSYPTPQGVRRACTQEITTEQLMYRKLRPLLFDSKTFLYQTYISYPHSPLYW